MPAVYNIPIPSDPDEPDVCQQCRVKVCPDICARLDAWYEMQAATDRAADKARYAEYAESLR